MHIQIFPMDVDGVLCCEAEVSVSISNSVAIRIVPIGANGEEQIDATLAIVGDHTDPEIDNFMASVRDLVQGLAESKGF